MLLKPAGKKISFCNVMSLLRTLCSLRHGWFVSWPRHVRRILRGRHNVDQRPAQHNTQACTQGYRSTGNRIHDCLSKVIPSCIEITNLASRCGYRQPPHQLRIHFAFAFAQCPNQPRFCRVMSWERMLRISGSRAHVLLDLWIASSLDRELSIWSNFQSRG